MEFNTTSCDTDRAAVVDVMLASCVSLLLRNNDVIIVYDVINDVITIEVYVVTMKCLSQYRLLVLLDELLLEAKNQTNYPTMTSSMTSQLPSKCGKIA